METNMLYEENSSSCSRSGAVSILQRWAFPKTWDPISGCLLFGARQGGTPMMEILMRGLVFRVSSRMLM